VHIKPAISQKPIAFTGEPKRKVNYKPEDLESAVETAKFFVRDNYGTTSVDLRLQSAQVLLLQNLNQKVDQIINSKKQG
jgi:hypothetical protein